MIYETHGFSKKKALEHKSQNSGLSRRLDEGFRPNTSPAECIIHACLGTLQKNKHISMIKK